MRFRLIEDHRLIWPVRVMCDALSASPSGYYLWRSRPESPRKIANRELLGDIQRIHAHHRGRYGAPRIHAELRAEGQAVSRKRIERVMRRHGIRAQAPRRYRVCTTDSKHSLPVAPNLLAQNFIADRPNRVWLADARPKASGWSWRGTCSSRRCCRASHSANSAMKRWPNTAVRSWSAARTGRPLFNGRARYR